MNPSLSDIALHNLSLQIADVYRGLYNEAFNESTLNDLLNAYRNVRRGISTMSDGKRYGSREAAIRIGTVASAD